VNRKNFILALALSVFVIGGLAYKQLNFVALSPNLEASSVEDGAKLLVSELKRLDRWVTVKTWLNDSTNRFVFDNELVIDLYQNPYAHYSLFLHELSSQTVDISVKVQWARLLQCLRPQDLVDLIGTISSSDLPGGDKAKLIRTVVWPGIEWGTQFADGYASSPYREALDALRAQETRSSDVRETVEYLTSGEGKSFLNSHSLQDGAYPRNLCHP